MTQHNTRYTVVELDRSNPYGERIELKVGLKDLDSGEVVASMNVGLSRHQVENYDLGERLSRYKGRLKDKIE